LRGEWKINVTLVANIFCCVKKKYKHKTIATILFLDGSQLIETGGGTIIVEAKARYGVDWCIYKTEYSSFSYN
jgi:hypothetical protein